MRFPAPFLLLALVFWGWQSDLLLWGAAMGGVLESARFARGRWELQEADFRRFWNVSLLLFLGAAMFLFFAYEGWGAMTDLARDPARAANSLRTTSQGLLRLLEWMPLLFFPFMAAHAFSAAGPLPLSTLSPWLRRRRRTTSSTASWDQARFQPALGYLGLVLFSASAGGRHPEFYFPALAAILALALWPYRSRRFAWTTWATTLGLALAVAYVGQRGLLAAVQQLEQLEGQWLTQWANTEFDALGVRTDLGAVGRRKGSSAIVLRVRAVNGSPPTLLREAVFTQFRSPYWTAGDRDYRGGPVPQQDVWHLGAATSPRSSAQITRYSRKGQLALALPAGTFELRELVADVVETNRLSAARAEGTAALVTYAPQYGPGPGLDTLPNAEDLDLAHLRPADLDAVQRAATELQLPGLDPQAALERLNTWLLSEFEYALDRGPEEPVSRAEDASALGDFLFKNRRGHCEYFATASTLLLRAAGINSRYVVGYSVQEPSGEGFVVRGRHAHAWAMAWIGNRWVTVDNTPANWSALDGLQPPFWQGLYDGLSGLWWRFTLWRQGETHWRLYVFLLGTGVLMFMAYRELRGTRWRRKRSAAESARGIRTWAGADSEFYDIVKALERQSAQRHPADTLRQWIQVVGGSDSDLQQGLLRLLELHYRLRFDPAGLDPDRRVELRTGVARWLAQYRRKA